MFPKYCKLYLRFYDCVFGGCITIKITFASFEAMYHFGRTILKIVFCKSSSSDLLVLQFLKSLFTAIKRV